jgi:hypothetical protein
MCKPQFRYATVNPKNRGLYSNLLFGLVPFGGYRFISNQTSTARAAGVTPVAAHGATPVGQNVVFVISTRWPPAEDGTEGSRFSALAVPPVHVSAERLASGHRQSWANGLADERWYS